MANDDVTSGTLVNAQKIRNDDWNQTENKSDILAPSSACLVVDEAKEDIPAHQWMQEYHRTRHVRPTHPPNPPLVANGYTIIASHLLEQPKTMHNVNAKLNGLKIDPGVNASHKQGQNLPETPYKRNKSDPLDGYRVYKGPMAATSGFLHNHDRHILRSDSPPAPGTIHDSPKSAGQGHGRRANLPSFYFPENLVIPKQLGKDGANSKQPSAQFYTSPFRSHLPPRPRPQSATISTGSQRIGDRSKSNKSRQQVRKGRPPLQVSPKTPCLKFNQSVKLSDQRTPSRDVIPPSPRQIGTIPRPSFKLDVNAGVKPDLAPKSILKNTSTIDAKFYLANDLIQDTSDQNTSYNTIMSDFSLQDFIFSPRTANRSGSSGKKSPSSSHVTSVPNEMITSPRRPMSAYASPAKYELKEIQSPRRKSVTFNSYVSLMSGNRVSTIRSLSVDV